MKNISMKVKVAVMLFLMTAPTLLFAQPVFDEQVEDVHVPFDGGVAFLVAAAIGYGVFGVWQYKRNEKQKKSLMGC